MTKSAPVAAGFSSIISKARTVNPFSLRSISRGLFALFTLCAFYGCADARRAVVRHDVVPVVTTTTVLVDFVQAVGGDHVSVRSIVPTGASVESYEPTPQDAVALHDARLLVENGAGLENWLNPLIDNAKATDLEKIVVSDGLPLVNHNPHLWMDPMLVRTYIARIRDGLIAVDPMHRASYTANARRYDLKLFALTASVQQQINTIPKKRRLMLVYHDAWRYYDQRFGLRTAGVIELAPGRESSASEIAKLVDQARAAHISVVFSEPEESSRLADALASSLPDGKVIPLYVDTLGTSAATADYLGLIRSDTRAIVAALK